MDVWSWIVMGAGGATVGIQNIILDVSISLGLDVGNDVRYWLFKKK